MYAAATKGEAERRGKARWPFIDSLLLGLRPEGQPLHYPDNKEPDSGEKGSYRPGIAAEHGPSFEVFPGLEPVCRRRDPGGRLL